MTFLHLPNGYSIVISKIVTVSPTYGDPSWRRFEISTDHKNFEISARELRIDELALREYRAEIIKLLESA